MTETTVVTQEQVQPDPKAIAEMQAKIARVQKILGFLAWGQLIVAILLALAPFLLRPMGLSASPTEPFAYQGLAIFFVALAYAANFCRKEIAVARLCLRTTAIAQLGFALVAIISLFAYALPSSFWVLVILSLIFGGLPAYVIYQFQKASK